MNQHEREGPLYADDFDGLVAGGCGNPGCTHEGHDYIFLGQACHPGAGVEIMISKGDDRIFIACHRCHKPVGTVMGARRSPVSSLTE